LATASILVEETAHWKECEVDVAAEVVTWKASESLLTSSSWGPPASVSFAENDKEGTRKERDSAPKATKAPIPRNLRFPFLEGTLVQTIDSYDLSISRLLYGNRLLCKPRQLSNFWEFATFRFWFPKPVEINPDGIVISTKKKGKYPFVAFLINYFPFLSLQPTAWWR